MKQFSLKFVVMAFILFMSMNAIAQTYVTINKLKYQLNGTVAYVAGYTGGSTDVVIPATIESDGLTFKVIKINNNAFKGTSITSIRSEGENLKTIDNGTYSYSSYSEEFYYSGAFSGCSSLTTVQLQALPG